MNPLNPEIEAAYLTCNSNGSFEINLDNDFTLVGKTKALTLDITDYKALFSAKESLEEVK